MHERQQNASVLRKTSSHDFSFLHMPGLSGSDGYPRSQSRCRESMAIFRKMVLLQGSLQLLNGSTNHLSGKNRKNFCDNLILLLVIGTATQLTVFLTCCLECCGRRAQTKKNQSDVSSTKIRWKPNHFVNIISKRMYGSCFYMYCVNTHRVHSSHRGYYNDDRRMKIEKTRSRSHSHSRTNVFVCLA